MIYDEGAAERGGAVRYGSATTRQAPSPQDSVVSKAE